MASSFQPDADSRARGRENEKRSVHTPGPKSPDGDEAPAEYVVEKHHSAKTFL
jgi:hypothetical protein